MDIDYWEETKSIGFYVLAAVLIGYVVFTPFLGVGYKVLSGDSMEPTYSESCALVEVTDVNTTDLENEVVIYDAEYTNAIVSHRVVEVYPSYDPETARHYIEDGMIFDRKTRIGVENKTKNTDELTGEKVLILKGDNNEYVDPQLVRPSEVNGIVTDCVLDAESVPFLPNNPAISMD